MTKQEIDIILDCTADHGEHNRHGPEAPCPSPFDDHSCNHGDRNKHGNTGASHVAGKVSVMLPSPAGQIRNAGHAQEHDYKRNSLNSESLALTAFRHAPDHPLGESYRYQLPHLSPVSRFLVLYFVHLSPFLS